MVIGKTPVGAGVAGGWLSLGPGLHWPISGVHIHCGHHRQHITPVILLSHLCHAVTFSNFPTTSTEQVLFKNFNNARNIIAFSYFSTTMLSVRLKLKFVKFKLLTTVV